MKKLLVFAAALGLLVCAPASAQNNDHRGNRHDNGAANAAHASKPAETQRGVSNMKGRDNATMRKNTSDGHNAMTARTPVTRQNAVAAKQNRFLPKSGDIHPANRAVTDTHRNTGWTGNTNRAATDRNRNNNNWSGNTNTNRAATDRNRNNNKNWSGNNNSNHAVTDRNRNNNNNWSGNTTRRQGNLSSLRRNTQASHRFHGGNYHRPTGYQYRHWGYGERLPRSYYVRNYWIADFLMFGLFAPPDDDLIWVRVGDDALLIDRDTGDIVQVQYGVFY